MAEEISTETPDAQAPETPKNDPLLSELETEGKSEEPKDDQNGEEQSDPAKQSEEPKEPEAPAEDADETGDDEKDGEETEGDDDSDEDSKKDEENLDPEEAKKEEARKRFQERERVREERRQRVQKLSDEYVNEDGISDEEKRIREIEARDYGRLTEANESALLTEFERVRANPNLQMFNPDSDQYNPRLATRAIRDFGLGYIEYDRAGNMVRLNGSLYQYLNETAELFGDAVKSGQFQQVRADRKNKAKADPKPAASPKEPAKDPILDVLSADD